MKKTAAILLALALLLSLSTAAFATGSPSVEREEVSLSVTSGHDAVIEGPNGEITYADLGTELELIITPYLNRDYAIIHEITDFLNSAGEQITAADTVSDLTTAIYAALQKVKDASDDPRVKALTVQDLAVWDVFDATLVQDHVRLYRMPDGSKIVFAVQTDLRPGDIFFLLHNREGATWEVVEDCSLDEDGVLTIRLDSLSALAIIVESYHDVTTVDASAPTSPQTGETSSLPATGAALLGAAVAAAVGCGAVLRKKRAR